ncbi:hypothetical protein VIBHAR_06083 [Vibrio campbellii ATCC BAA-1116]|uniref:Uncharacterized protein n=1 Tax=Vibrio campbellii (strain ATCC BAA-1116) TaxID=2902295 RepID=A7N2C7_VIBC1|nr:hypothetical protein VIBHAR_06083 [Vibrio campbellii ATCC BAA-1116]
MRNQASSMITGIDQIVNHSYSNISTTLQKIIDQEHERLFKTKKFPISK